MLKYYGEHIRIYISYINPNETKEISLNDKAEIEKKLEEVNKQIAEKGELKRFVNQKKELEIELNAKDKTIHEMEELKEKYGDEIRLSTAMFIDYPYEMSYMYSGSYNDDVLKKYCGPDAVQWETLKYAIEHNIDHYNFYGITGNFEENDGVYEYKKGFNGVAEKMVGEFVLPIKPSAYKLYKKLKG